MPDMAAQEIAAIHHGATSDSEGWKDEEAGQCDDEAEDKEYPRQDGHVSQGPLEAKALAHYGRCFFALTVHHSCR